MFRCRLIIGLKRTKKGQSIDFFHPWGVGLFLHPSLTQKSFLQSGLFCVKDVLLEFKAVGCVCGEGISRWSARLVCMGCKCHQHHSSCEYVALPSPYICVAQEPALVYMLCMGYKWLELYFYWNWYMWYWSCHTKTSTTSTYARAILHGHIHTCSSAALVAIPATKWKYQYHIFRGYQYHIFTTSTLLDSAWKTDIFNNDTINCIDGNQTCLGT